MLPICNLDAKISSKGGRWSTLRGQRGRRRTEGCGRRRGGGGEEGEHSAFGYEEMEDMWKLCRQ